MGKSLSNKYGQKLLDSAKKSTTDVLKTASKRATVKHTYDSVMCGYFWIGFIDFMFKGKTLTEYTNIFSLNNFKKNDDMILKYFMNNAYV